VLAGTQKAVFQQWEKCFWQVEMNYTIGVDMVDNTTINNTLTFTNGFLYIDDYLMTMGTNANRRYSRDNKLIILNGVLSDLGLKTFSFGCFGCFYLSNRCFGNTRGNYTTQIMGPRVLLRAHGNSYHPG
jgi:hypothetical protein